MLYEHTKIFKQHSSAVDIGNCKVSFDCTGYLHMERVTEASRCRDKHDTTHHEIQTLYKPHYSTSKNTITP